MSIIKKFLNLYRFVANLDRFVETIRVDNSGNVLIRFKRNVHINTAGHIMLTSRKGHILVKGEHFHMQPSIPDLYANSMGFTNSSKVIEHLQKETRLKLEKLYGDKAPLSFPTYMFKTPVAIESEIDEENKKGKIEWKF